MDYRTLHARSIADREGFWGEQAALIDWQRPFDRVLEYGEGAAKPGPFARWFVGGTTNLCHNAIDRHLPARADAPAIPASTTKLATSTAALSLLGAAHTFTTSVVGSGDRIVLVGGDYAAQDEHDTPAGWMLGTAILAQVVETDELQIVGDPGAQRCRRLVDAEREPVGAGEDGVHRGCNEQRALVVRPWRGLVRARMARLLR